MSRAPKDAIVLCLDVGLGMQNAAPDCISPLEEAIQVLSKLIERKIFADSKDEMSLVLFGCNETANQLANDDDYNNISVAFQLQIANFEFLRYISSSIKPGSTTVDFLDVLTVCLDLLHNEKKGRKIKRRKIVLLTNFDHNCNDDSIEGIIGGFSANGMDVEFNIIVPHRDMIDDVIVDNNSSLSDNGDKPSTSAQPSKKRKLDTNGNIIDPHTQKPKSQNQIQGEIIAEKILKSVSGAFYSFSQAIVAVTGFEKRSVNSAAWKCHLTLGNELTIPCVAYAKTKEAKPKHSWKKKLARPSMHQNLAPMMTPRIDIVPLVGPSAHSSCAPDLTIPNTVQDITKNDHHYINDDEQTEVKKKNILKGYKYGKDIIPFGAEDEKQLKYTTDGKCLSILGFTNLDNIPPSVHMDDQAHFVLPESLEASTGLSALVIGMNKQHLCAIACYVYRKGSNPKLVALIPHCKSDYKCFVMVSLPFSEDVRPLSFKSLKTKKCQPTASQLDSMESLIDSMNLCSDQQEELYEPKKMLNPHFQRIFQSLLQRSMHPDQSIPQTDVNFDSILSPNAGVVERSQKILNNIKNVFPLHRRNSKKADSVKRWKIIKKEENDEHNSMETTSDACLPLAQITMTRIESVGTVSPHSDFLAVLTSCKSSHNEDQSVESAFNQLQQRIENFVSDPFADRLENKIISCLKALTSQAEQYNRIEAVNQFLMNLKTNLIAKNRELWKMLVKNDIGLVGDSDDKFLSDEVKISTPEPVEYEEQEAEDLLDMME